MTKSQETWSKKLKAINEEQGRKTIRKNKQGASINAWLSRWTKAWREEKPICACDRGTTCDDGSILTHGGNLHRCCSDGQTDTKQIVPNSGPCSTTGK